VGAIVSAQPALGPRTPVPPATSRTLVWIDAREAVIVRASDGDVMVEHALSDVPPHVRATGHVRHDPAVRHGGGRAQSTVESHRIEHLDRFTDRVAARLSPTDDLTILGSGRVHEQLARRVRESDAHHRRRRSVDCEPAPRLTDRQLVAWLHRRMGLEPRRRSVGAYRWTWSDAGVGATTAGAAPRRCPRRVAPKPRRMDEEASP
jgi:hypothetical protein